MAKENATKANIIDVLSWWSFLSEKAIVVLSLTDNNDGGVVI